MFVVRNDPTKGRRSRGVNYATFDQMWSELLRYEQQLTVRRAAHLPFAALRNRSNLPLGQLCSGKFQ